MAKRTIRSDIPGNESYTGSAQSDGNSTLYVGQNIVLNGEIKACEHLIVDGQLHTELNNAQRLEIREPGIVYGTIEVSDAIIDGRFEGDLTVTGRLVIGPTGHITGNICYNSLNVEPGASVLGKITRLPQMQDNQESVAPEQNNSFVVDDAINDLVPENTMVEETSETGSLFKKVAG